MEQRVGVIGIVIEDRNMAPKINSILSEHNEIIIGRMGVPYRERGISVISLIVDGSTDEVGAMITRQGIDNLKKEMIKTAPKDWTAPSIVGDLIKPGDTAVLVVPIDLAAPKGRLILPQVQTIRDILDNGRHHLGGKGEGTEEGPGRPG